MSLKKALYSSQSYWSLIRSTRESNAIESKRKILMKNTREFEVNTEFAVSRSLLLKSFYIYTIQYVP